MLFLHAGVLPPLASKPHKVRHFSYRGWGLLEGVLVIESDQYLTEWDADEQCWMLAKQTGEPEIYCTRPDSCNCLGWIIWNRCKHSKALALLLKATNEERKVAHVAH